MSRASNQTENSRPLRLRRKDASNNSFIRLTPRRENFTIITNMRKLPVRNDLWQESMKHSVSKMNQDVADGLISDYGDGAIAKKASKALRNMCDVDRKTLWSLAFAGIHEEIELAWLYLDPNIIPRREGGQGCNGTRFTFAPSAEEADLNFFCMLRNLLHFYSGPYPHANLVTYFEEIFHVYDEVPSVNLTKPVPDLDCIAYLACVTFNQKLNQPQEDALLAVLEKQLLAPKHRRYVRYVHTAIFCSVRSDLWDRFHDIIAKNCKNLEIIDRIIGDHCGTNPNEFFSLLKSLYRNDILQKINLSKVSYRGETIELISSFLGIEGHWVSKKWEEAHALIGRVLETCEKMHSEQDALPDDPMQCFLVLWSMAMYDGDRILDLISEPAALSVNARIAAVHLLKACPAQKRQFIAYRYAVDSDLRIANTAAQMLNSFHDRLLEKNEKVEVFRSFYKYLKNLPTKPRLDEYPYPFINHKLDLQPYYGLIANMFPDGSEDELAELLPQMDTWSRSCVVRRLNRYRKEMSYHDMLMHGRDPEELRRLKEDKVGVQSKEQRRMLLTMIHERNADVANEAVEEIGNMQIELVDFEILRPIIKGKNEQKKSQVRKMISWQREPFIENVLALLKASKNQAERDFAAEIANDISSGR